MSAQEMGSLNIQARLRAAMALAIKASRYSRYEIVGRMSNLVNAEITIHQLNSWTAESKDGHRPPGEYIPAFCVATESFDPLKVLVEPCSMFVLPGEDALGADLAKKIQERDELNQQIREMKMFLKEARRRGK